MPTSPENILDLDVHRRTADPHDVIALSSGLPQQCRQAVEIGREFAGRMETETPRGVVFVGMGGSAVAGDILHALSCQIGTVPLSVVRDYVLPAWAGPDTLVLISSYSGNTEETLSCFEEAVRRRCRIAAVTSGGILSKRCAEQRFPTAVIPGGQPPRTATGFILFPMLLALDAVGFWRRPVQADIEETLTLLDEGAASAGPDVPFALNPAKKLAAALHGRVPVLYGSQTWLGVVANRLKCQINENAKLHAFANALPEQNHNEILAWEQCSAQADRWSVVFLRDTWEERTAPRHHVRVEALKSLIGQTANIHEVRARGESLLARIMSLFIFGDFVSVYLAYLQQVDPYDIGGIEMLKVELARSAA